MAGFFIALHKYPFFCAGHVSRRDRRDTRRHRAGTVHENSRATFSSDSQMCLQSSLPGNQHWYYMNCCHLQFFSQSIRPSWDTLNCLFYLDLTYPNIMLTSLWPCLCLCFGRWLSVRCTSGTTSTSCPWSRRTTRWSCPSCSRPCIASPRSTGTRPS